MRATATEWKRKIAFVSMSFGRRAVMRCLLGCALLIGLSCGKQNEGPTCDPPNILLISLDALRSDHLSCYGYARKTSPFLDKVAAGGILFSQAFVNTHGTPPSHTTILTSLYQETHRVSCGPPLQGWKRHIVPDEVVMLQEILRANGYVTLGVTDGALMSRAFGFNRGFDDYSDKSRGAEEGTRRMVEAIRRNTHGKRPIFAFFHTYEIHCPYTPPQKYRELFGRSVSPYEATTKKMVELCKKGLLQEDVIFMSDMYDAEIRFTDDLLREMFRDLEALGFFDNYLLLITADHGDEFGEHGRLSHGATLYDELLHVPLIAAGTGLPHRVVDDRLVSSVDIVPTILARLGLSSPMPLAGRDLLAPEDEGEADEAAIFSQYATRLYSIRTRRWKLIEEFRPERSTQLYDLLNDPLEQVNLADRKPKKVAALQGRLSRWREGLPKLGAIHETRGELPEPDMERLKSLGYIE